MQAAHRLTSSALSPMARHQADGPASRTPACLALALPRFRWLEPFSLFRFYRKPATYSTRAAKVSDTQPGGRTVGRRYDRKVWHRHEQACWRATLVTQLERRAGRAWGPWWGRALVLRVRSSLISFSRSRMR